MRIMTFNIQHALDYKKRVIDYELFVKAIAEQDPDICGLNEIRGRGWLKGYANQTKKLADGLGYNGYFGKAVTLDFGNPFGNALLSRYSFKSVETVAIPDPPKTEKGYYETRCIIKAVFELEGKDVMILVTHMGLMLGERLNAVKVICDILDNTDIPVVLMGDFNNTPEAAELRPIYERLTDTDRTGDYTFPSDKPIKKIDYIFYRGLECTRVETINKVVSDHLPIVAEFDII